MTEQKEWTLGGTSLWFESRGRGAGEVSSGKGDHGGKSYGIYQMSSNAGTVADYVRTSPYAPRFKGHEVNSSPFIDTWKTIARDDPAFGADQHEYIKRTHYQPFVSRLARSGFDVDERGPAIKDMAWSISVQYGGGSRATSIVTRGLNEAFGEDYRLENLTDAQIVSAVQDSKLRHVLEDFRNSMPNTPGIETRIVTERRGLETLAETGVPMTVTEISAVNRDLAPMTVGSSGERVTALQASLADLGFLSRKGSVIEPDGHFGLATEDAVKAFQSSNGLYPHGQASALTLDRIAEQVVSRDVGMEKLREDARVSLTCPADKNTRIERTHASLILVSDARATPPSVSLGSVLKLSDPSHPDHAFFNQVRGHVAELDKSLGRLPDQYTDNIASALTVQARADGLHRVDQIALSSKGDALWAVQTPPGRKDHLFDQKTNVKTEEANTPMEQSGAKWPEAMQQFQGHEQERALSQQRAQDRSVAESQAQAATGPAMAR